MTEVFEYGVIVAFIYTFLTLSYLVIKTFSFGKKQLLSKPQGEIQKGVIYALGKGLLPWEKESASRNLPTYVAGVLYHSGIFLTILYTLFEVFSIVLVNWLLHFFQTFILIGFLCGLGLLIKRILKDSLRKISCPDDFVANILVDIFLLSAFLNTFYTGIKLIFFSVTILLLLYIPAGKIRHCFFFFYSRILFGIFFGRRGVLPHKPGRA
ncbi:MAG: hypothetical protein IBX60_07390 [Candidatus Aminicenantes bacterium]|nr:hypothetical protein [Candidatus Aminicenantes bacterium]